MPSIRDQIRRLSQENVPINCSVEVDDVRAVSAGFMRVTVSGADLGTYRTVMPADAFKLALPPAGRDAVDFPRVGADGIPYWPPGTHQPVLRAFSVRHFDARERRLQFDVLRHPGLAAQWLSRATKGDVVGLSGMRREFYAGDDADHHLLIGDACTLPAISAIIESLPIGLQATVYLAVDDDSDRQLVPQRDGVEVRWVGSGSPVGAESALERATRTYVPPPGRTQAWLGAEASVMRELRRFVLGELGVARTDLHSAAYWKSGLDSTQLDTVQLGRYKQVMAAGADAADPDTRDEVELSA